MTNQQTSQDPQPAPAPVAQQDRRGTPPDFDGLEDKKPEELTPEELRWMADTMPGDGPGD